MHIQEEQDRIDGGHTVLILYFTGAVHTHISNSRRRDFDAHGNTVKMNQLELEHYAVSEKEV